MSHAFLGAKGAGRLQSARQAAPALSAPLRHSRWGGRAGAERAVRCRHGNQTARVSKGGSVGTARTLRALAKGVDGPDDRARQQPLHPAEHRDGSQQRQVQPRHRSAKEAEPRSATLARRRRRACGSASRDRHASQAWLPRDYQTAVAPKPLRPMLTSIVQFFFQNSLCASSERKCCGRRGAPASAGRVRAGAAWAGACWAAAGCRAVLGGSSLAG